MTRTDLVRAYSDIDPGKVTDIDRMLKMLPPEKRNDFSPEDLQGLNLGWMTNRSRNAFELAMSGAGSKEGGGAEGEQMNALSELMGLSREQANYARQYAEWLKGQLTPIAGAQKDLAGRVAGISQDYLKETTPLRQALTGAIERKLGLPVSNAAGLESPVAFFGPRAPEREALESQFANARQDAISTAGARGGQLSRALIQLPQERARAIAGMESQATNEAVDAGMKIGMGGLPTALQGLAGASGMYGNAAGTLAQVPQTNLAGSMAGMGAAASGFGGIAERSLSASLARAQLLQNENLRQQQAQAGKKSGLGQLAGSLAPAAGSAAIKGLGELGTLLGSAAMF